MSWKKFKAVTSNTVIQTSWDLKSSRKGDGTEKNILQKKILMTARQRELDLRNACAPPSDREPHYEKVQKAIPYPKGGK